MKNYFALIVGMLVASFAIAQNPTPTSKPAPAATQATAPAPAAAPAASAASASAPAAPAATAVPADQPSKEDVMKLLAALHVRDNMSDSLEHMRDQIKQGSRQGFQMQRLEPTPEQLGQVDAMIDKMFTQVPYEEMLQAMAPVYQKHFTKSELDAVVNFYGSPAGQKLLKEQPEMMKEGMQAGGTVMQAKMEPLMKQLDEDMKTLEGQMKKAPEPASPAVAPKKAPAKSGTKKPTTAKKATGAAPAPKP